MHTKPFRMLLNLLVIAALALSLTPLTPTAAQDAPPQDLQESSVAPAAPAPLLQFTAGGHVVGFAPM